MCPKAPPQTPPWCVSVGEALTALLLFVAGELLDGAAVAEAAHRTLQPLPQSVRGALGARRAGLQRVEGRLRLEVGHGLRLSIGAADGVVF